MDPVRLRAAAAGVLIALAAGLVAASPALDGLRGFSIDVLTMLRWRVFGNAHPPASSHAVVIAFDEETFRTPPFEGSPSVTWTPEIGRVLTAIIDAGAKVVGFDIIFPTSIEQSAVPFGDATLGTRLRGFDRDYLRALALGARADKVVLGQVQHHDNPVLPSPGQRAAVGHGRNIRSLNLYSDPDGVIRRVPLVFTVDGEPVPAMAAELAARASGAPVSTQVVTRGAVADTITLNFAGGADDIPTFSLADLRACVEKDDKDFFRRHFDGKVVLIGTVLDVEDRKITSKRFATAPEGARAARCALTAPAVEHTFSRETISGVYVHATAVNNLLRRDALSRIRPYQHWHRIVRAGGACRRGRAGARAHRGRAGVPWHCGGLECGCDDCVPRRAVGAAGRAAVDRPRLAWRHDWLSSCRRRPHDGGTACPEARARGGDGERRCHSAGNAAEHAAE